MIEHGTGDVGAPCHTARDCREGTFCDFLSDLCNYSGGRCALSGTACKQTLAPACGCDGRVYATECAAERAGVDVGYGCSAEDAPPGLFPCGPEFCDPTTQYCASGGGDGDDYYFSCQPIPEECSAPVTCECFADWADSCNEVQGNGVTGIEASDSWLSERGTSYSSSSFRFSAARREASLYT